MPLTPLVLALVLGAALLHAGWNAAVKATASPGLAIASFQLTGAVICLALAPWVTAPSPGSWPFIVASALIHNVYYFTLARAYRTGDLSQVYPIFRGAAPVLVTAAAALTADEWLSRGATLGILLVSLGISSLGFMHSRLGRLRRDTLLWASSTALLIAAYTVVDGLGVRASGSELGYIVWLFVLEVVPIGTVLLIVRRRKWLGYMRGNLATVVGGGVASSTAYGLVIYAMSLGAMGVVSSLRETSVIFAAIIGAVILHEPFGRARIRAAVIVALGIVVMRVFG